MITVELQRINDWSKDEFLRKEYQAVVRSGTIQRQRVGLGGSHTVVTYPPLDCLGALNTKEVLRAVRPTDHLNLYLHIAFCEHICPFCHYETARTDPHQPDARRSAYLEALTRELDGWKSHLDGSALESLYVGGGTPTSIPLPELLALCDKIAHFSKRSNFCACVETSPLTAAMSDGRTKLEALTQAGITRFSVGIQSFDEALLQRYRDHGRDIAIQAVALVMERGVEVNVDLIQDLPGQSDDSIIDDIEHINALRPHQVTWYILRLHQGSALFGQQGRMANEFISPAESARRRALIRKAMSFIGYIPRPGGRFVRSAAIFDTYKSVRGGESPLIGIGGSAYSHGWGYFFRNRPSVRNKSSLQGYIESIQRSGFAIEVGLPLDEVELLAGKLVTGIRSKVAVPRPTELTRGYLTEASNILDSLENAGLVEQDSDNFYSLTETGSLFEEEICALFYSRRIRELLSREPMTGLVGIHI